MKLPAHSFCSPVNARGGLELCTVRLSPVTLWSAFSWLSFPVFPKTFHFTIAPLTDDHQISRHLEIS